MHDFQATLQKAEAGKDLTREDVVTLLSADGPEETKLLFEAANRVREKCLGDEVHLRGIIEFSNHCERNCHYCGLRFGNAELQRYRIEPEQIVEIARRATHLGYRTIVLQSGEDPWYTAETLAGVVRRLKDELQVAVTVCVGDRSREDYEAWKEAGADRYLLKHETRDEKLFARLRPGTRFEDRALRLGWLRELGYQVGSGSMVGLPGQTIGSIAEDLLFLRDLDVEMAGIGPFIPHPETPLSDTEGGTLEMTLKAVATARLLMPWTHLPATTAVGSIDKMGRQKALGCGANVVMPNITPGAYRDRYQIYPNKICLNEEPEHCRPCIEGIIRSVGRKVGTGYGHSPKHGSWARTGKAIGEVTGRVMGAVTVGTTGNMSGEVTGEAAKLRAGEGAR